MKRFLIIFLCSTIFLGVAAVLTGCDGIKNPTTTDNNGITVVCTSFAGFDFARSMLAYYTENGGEGVVQLVMLGKPGQDMHSFEPTVQDIITLSGLIS